MKGTPFATIHRQLAYSLLQAPTVPTPTVHQQDVKGKPEWVSIEVPYVSIDYPVPETVVALQEDVRPNLPWAENHFQERVSGEPWNPPPSAESWPYAQRGHEDHLVGGKFSHTYPERFWPKDAGRSWKMGIRYHWGDLDDLLDLLTADPLTRQAYLPVWFPEDLTAANQGHRVPCTLGYHFMCRDGALHLAYFIRSCDFVRFFRDDVYMACRLLQWLLDQTGWKDVRVGGMHMHICSLHCFKGDILNLKGELHGTPATHK